MAELLPCPVCNGSAAVGAASPSNPAMCGFKGWTADCLIGCEGAPYVSRFTREDAATAWNTLVAKRAAQQSKGEKL